jgi:hypothetical protein
MILESLADFDVVTQALRATVATYLLAAVGAPATFMAPAFSASTIATIVFKTESGFREMLSMPSATRNCANSG